MNDKRPILVTGGTGFLGQHVMNEFAHRDVDAVTYPRSVYDLTKIDNVRSVMLKHRPRIVIHMAAVYGGIGANKAYPADFIRANALMACNVFEVSRTSGVEFIYTIGTACAYPKNCQVPFKETCIWDGKPDETSFPYAMSKRLMIVMHDAHRNQHGLKGTQFILTNMYGEHDHFGLKDSNVMPALIRKFVFAKQANVPSVEVWGSGNATREFLYAGDAARAIVTAALSGFSSNLPMNIGTGTETSIREVVELIRDEVGYEGEITYLDDGMDGQPRRSLDVSFARNKLGFIASMPLREGVRKTIAWFSANGNRV